MRPRQAWRLRPRPQPRRGSAFARKPPNREAGSFPCRSHLNVRGVTDRLPRVRCHLQRMPLGKRKSADYAEFAGEEQIAMLQEAAQPLKGIRVLHLAAAGTRLRSPE